MSITSCQLRSPFLASRDIACQHVLDIGLAEAPDIQILNYAAEKGLVIISKDEDFFYLASQPNGKARLIWIRLGNCRTAVLLAALERLWPEVEARLLLGDRVIEIR